MCYKLFLFLCLAAAPALQAANLLVNGDFESPGAALTSDYVTMASNSLPGWTSTVGNGTGAANYYSRRNSSANWIPNPQSGNYSVQIDSSNTAPSYTSGGSLAQTISLTAGVPYILTFYLRPEADRTVYGAPITTVQLDVILNGGGFGNQNMINPSTGTTGFRSTWNGDPKLDPEVGWAQGTLIFTPTVSGNVTITFQDVWVNNVLSSNASLDNVYLEAVPEMTHWSISAAFGVIAAGTSVWRGRRKKQRCSERET